MLSRYVDGALKFRLKDIQDKEKSNRYYIMQMLNRTRRMFKWSGLPETIPERSLEIMLQTNGNVCFTHVNDNLYCFTGGLGGEPDAYYMPTIYTVANPALKFSKNLKIDEECVVMPSDSMYYGLLPLMSRYGTLLAENDISMLVADINSRIIALITATDSKQKAAAEEYINKIKKGELSAVLDNSFAGEDTIRTQPYASTSQGNTITQLIELEQYLKANFFMDLGINAQWNAKRESINSGESSLNDDMLIPLIDDMLECRREACEKINEMFGTNISVELASVWKENADTREAELENLQNDDEEEEKDDELPEDDRTDADSLHDDSDSDSGTVGERERDD